MILDPKFKQLYDRVCRCVVNGKKICLVSLTFAEELLTSRETPPSKLFDALRDQVITMHIERDIVEKGLVPHDPAILGSPCLSLRPSHVRLV